MPRPSLIRGRFIHPTLLTITVPTSSYISLYASSSSSSPSSAVTSPPQNSRYSQPCHVCVLLTFSSSLVATHHRLCKLESSVKGGSGMGNTFDLKLHPHSCTTDLPLSLQRIEQRGGRMGREHIFVSLQAPRTS